MNCLNCFDAAHSDSLCAAAHEEAQPSCKQQCPSLTTVGIHSWTQMLRLLANAHAYAQAKNKMHYLDIDPELAAQMLRQQCPQASSGTDM